jgi:SIR2-like domain
LGVGYKLMAIYGKMEIPDELIEAQKRNELVVFAGAGVSMGHPANMPSFEGLMRMACDRFQDPDFRLKPKSEGPIDPSRVFRTLESNAGKKHVREFVIEIFSKQSLPNKLHENLLRLFSKKHPVRILTTNYDTLFSEGLRKVPDRLLVETAYPDLLLEDGALPEGIAYLHGSVSGDPDNLILTYDDFAHAYMRKTPIVKDYLEKVLKSSHIMFIGYRLGDPVMNLFLTAQEDQGHLFAFCKANDFRGWQQANVQPIVYPAASEPNTHEHLEQSIAKWAEEVDASPSGRQHSASQVDSDGEKCIS